MARKCFLYVFGRKLVCFLRSCPGVPKWRGPVRETDGPPPKPKEDGVSFDSSARSAGVPSRARHCSLRYQTRKRRFFKLQHCQTGWLWKRDGYYRIRPIWEGPGHCNRVWKVRRFCDTSESSLTFYIEISSTHPSRGRCHNVHWTKSEQLASKTVNYDFLQQKFIKTNFFEKQWIIMET